MEPLTNFESPRNNGVLLIGLYTTWLTDLVGYSKQLKELKAKIAGQEAAGQNEFAEIKADIISTDFDLENVSDEICVRMKRLAYNHEAHRNMLSFTEIVERNSLGERLNKIEQSVFHLKYRLNKTLSIAS
jgi:hypothetical protein